MKFGPQPLRIKFSALYVLRYLRNLPRQDDLSREVWSATVADQIINGINIPAISIRSIYITRRPFKFGPQPLRTKLSALPMNARPATHTWHMSRTALSVSAEP